MNPFYHFVSEFARVAREGADCPLGGITPLPRPAPAPDAPQALLFSPHPDDESITGGLALRLLRECGWKISNVAVTLGSKPERRAERLEELKGACGFLGFDLLPTAPGGLGDVTTSARAKDPRLWAASVATIAGVLNRQQPRAIFFPHELDWNST